MSSPAFNRGWKKAARTVVQTIAGGGLTALVTVLAGGLSPQASVLIMAMFTALAAMAQNYLETGGTIPTLLPTPGLVVGPVAETVATVDAVVDSTGDIMGDVLDTGGDIIGEITGQTVEDPEKGGSGMIALLVIAFVIVIMVGFFSVCDLAFNDENEPGDNHLLGRIQLVSHQYDDGGDCDWDGDCGGYDNGDRNTGYGSDYGGNRRDDRNRNRGAFSPGPFDRSPIDFSYSCISLDCSGRDKKQDERDR